MIDRDALRSELSRMLRDDYEGFLSAEEVAAIAEYQTGRILALLRPVPPQGIDRDALIADAMRMLYEHSPSVDHEYDREEAEELVDRMLLHGSYLTAAPDRDIIAAAIQTDFGVRNPAAYRVADRILAIVRPVEGVVLTPEEAALAAEAVRTSAEWDRPPRELTLRRALAARLEALS